MSLTYKLCLISTALYFSFYASCISDFRNSLVGKWKNKVGKDTIVYFKEGTVCARENNVEVCGNYHIVDDNRIRVRFGRMGKIETNNISISNNELARFK